MEKDQENKLGKEVCVEFDIDEETMNQMPYEEIDNHIFVSPAVEIDESLMTHFSNIYGKS